MKSSSPTTSKTLLDELKGNAKSPRWREFYDIYSPWLGRHLRAKYLGLASRYDDVIQNVFVRVFKALPTYKFVEGEVGHFRAYLKCVTKNVVCDFLAKESRYEAFEDDAQIERLRQKQERDEKESESEKERRRWMSHVLYIAFNQVLSDENMDARTREVAYRFVIKHQKPEAIAMALGGSLTANAIYQMKSRIMAKVAKNTRSLWSALVNEKTVDVDYELRRLWDFLAHQKVGGKLAHELRSVAIDLSGELL